jgi:type IV pilus assembly protein PilN
MIRINLAPAREERARGGAFAPPHIHLGIVFGVALVALAAGLAIYGRALLGEEQRLTGEIESGAREVTALKATVGQATKMKEHLAELQARLSALNVLTKDQSRPLFLIDAFADAVPNDLWITGLDEKDRAVRVTGSAFSATAVSNLMTALRASGKFKDVDIVVSKRDLDKTPNLVTFEVTCRFEG